MQVTRSSGADPTAARMGPADWFTGDVYLDPVAAAVAPSRVQANLVHFMPGATPHRLMVHLALNEVDDDHVAAQWGEHVTDEEYLSSGE